TDEFAFAHHLVRESIDASLSAPRRVHWHRQLAGTLVRRAERLSPAHQRAIAAQISHHAHQAGDAALVFAWAPVAAKHASELYAYADALQALERASEAFGRVQHDS